MIWYVLAEYKKREKEKEIHFRELGVEFWSKFLLVFIPISIVNLYAIIVNNFIISSIGIIVFLVAAYFGSKSVDKKLDKKFGSGLERYKKQLDILRDVLKELELYSKAKIEYLIAQNGSKKEQWKFSTKVFKPFAAVTTTFLIPVISIILSSIFNNTELTDSVLMFIIIVIAIILTLLCIGYMLMPFVISLVDKEYLGFNSLQSLLEDIYLLDFIEAKEKNV